ncbi:ras-specific guanine nucleotide-releasing factor RalGPS1-like [Paramacrobiotus metropolitanus]|uniref:ras-specific guanine nucleotide-releasing factor RalGPS1-like n=1 Tax=Paramacrobiotus metropolitanus TaxID=2943436 RepID=UPI002446011C|nr:ras-specific guanine nucleotide-releasing factor RalGPS1-like [Paramacrobiotus metropolitanus]
MSSTTMSPPRRLSSHHMQHPQHARRNSVLTVCSPDFHFSTLPKATLKSTMSVHMARKRSMLVDEQPDMSPPGSPPPAARPPSGSPVERAEGVLRWKVEELASELTLIAHGLFQHLQACDLKALTWYNPRLKHTAQAQRVNEITRRFNYDGQWTVQEILRCETPRQRADVMGHFVRLAARLFELNNFHSSYAIFAALESCPIARLSLSHQALAKRDRLVWQQLGRVFCSEGNWRAFREYQESAGYPRIPHIGFYKTDLIHAYHAYSNPAERDRRMAAIEGRVFELFARSNYGFLEQRPPAGDYLNSLRYLDELQRFVDEENIKRSRQLEPERETTVGGEGKGEEKGERCLDEEEADAEKVNLIDDSLIEDVPMDESSAQNSFRLSLSDSSTSYSSSLTTLGSLQHYFTFQSVIERKSILKESRFLFLPRWKRYWMAVWGVHLITFKPKHGLLRCTERQHFQAVPSSVHVITQWRLLIRKDPVDSDGKNRKKQPEGEFTLRSADNAFVFKFRTRTVTEFREWVKYFRGAIGKSESEPNLMTFDA